MPRGASLCPSGCVFCPQGTSIPGFLRVVWNRVLAKLALPSLPLGRADLGNGRSTGDDSPAETGVCPTISRLGPEQQQ